MLALDSAHHVRRPIRIVPSRSVDTVLASALDHPGLLADSRAIDAIAFPEFMAHSDLAPLWSTIFAEFPEYQLALRERATDEHLAHANAVPFVWDGSPASLPQSAVEMVVRALRHKRQGLRPSAVGALQAVVSPVRQGTGLSSQVLQALAERAAELGASVLMAPIRPTHKQHYPLIPLESYVQWLRPDGLPIDPWQRVHLRLGAASAEIAPNWLSVTGSVADWSAWTGLTFPVSGSYVVPGALAPIEIDAESNLGYYVEPHLWMRYRLTESVARVAA